MKINCKLKQMESLESIIIAIITSILLFVSESLPFIKQIKSNGIIHLFIEYFKNTENTEDTEDIEDIEDTEILLPIGNESKENVILDLKRILNQNSKRVDDIENKYKTNQNQIMNIYDNLIDSRKIQASEKYEIDYIIRYIRTSYPEKQMEMRNLSDNTKKTLLLLGYRVDYDSIANVSVIKW